MLSPNALDSTLGSKSFNATAAKSNTSARSEMRIALHRDQFAGCAPIADQVLLERIAKRDQRAMKTLFTRHRDQAFRFILRLTRDEDIAEEVLIETFFEVWRSSGRFEGRSAFSTWLLAIARHKALSALGRPPSIELDEDMAAAIPDLGCDPELALEAKDLGEILRSCLVNLSSKHTEVIDLVYYHEKTITETARILRLPEATVKTRMFYARQKLAELLRAKLSDNSARAT